MGSRVVRRAGPALLLLVALLSGCAGGPDDDGQDLPPVGAVVDYQLGGAYEPADDVEVVTRDRTSAPDPDRYGGHVIEIEYTDNGRDTYEDVCDDAAGRRSILLRDRDVTPVGDPEYVFEHC